MIKRILINVGHPIYLFFLKTVSLLGKIKDKFGCFLKAKVIKTKKSRIIFKWSKYYAIFSGILILMSIICGWFYVVIIKDLPNVNDIYNPPRLSTKIYDRKGILLYTFYKDENRSWVELSKIPKEMIESTIAIEDKDFFTHKGISIRGIFIALWHNIKNSNNDLRGGSTITQQLVKNVFLSGEKTWKRKTSELILSLMIENKLTKNEILERYFNQVAYGGETYGVEAAAEKYFGKKIEEINLSEATFLAGLPAAPSSYLPTGESLNLAYQRQKQVIDQMRIAGFIDIKTANELISSQVTIINNETSIKAPHFVFYIRDYLKENLGFNNIERRGLSIYTTLDYETQKIAEEVVSSEIVKVIPLRISNGAAMVTDPRTGDILAMVGSKNFWSKEIDGKFNITTAMRQPGSSIKPINYLLGLENGKSLSSIIEDSPVTYKIKGQKPYTPQNYNGKSMGKVTLKTALASSLNIPSVKLLNENGISNMIDLAELMGITTWKDRSRFGLSLALGAGEVKMVEMAEAYSTFSQLGTRVVINPINEINNYLSETVYKKSIEKIYVTDPKYAYLINTALSDDTARSPVFGLGSKLKIPGKTVAVKTGTTNNLRDNWCIGWTPEIMVLAWVGNNDNSPMSWVASGVSGATPIWNRIMKSMLPTDASDVTWEMPSGVYKLNTCGHEGLYTDGRENGIECPAPSPTPLPI
ncbi:MAG: transglycosylase domain-containing protein [Candidatus Shapirobacteria bacterium]